MVEISEKGWKKALTSILEELEESQYKKMLEYLYKLPRRMREETSRDMMPEKIVQYYGLKESISAISEAVDHIPRRDEDIQNLLQPFMDWLTQEEKENQGKKRKLNEVEDKEEEERSTPERRKLSELKEGQRSAADPLMSCQTAEERRCPSRKISIRDLKSRDQLLETEAFSGKVLEQSALRRYQNQDGKKKFFLYLGVADETASVKVRVYKKELQKIFKEGHSYMFRNVIKDENVVKVTKQSTVSETRSVKVPEELELEAQKLIYPESELYSIDEAKKCPNKNMSVEGTVEEIAPVEETRVSYQTQKVKTQRLKLRDETGSIWTCMWGEKTRQCRDLSLGDVVKMTNMRINKYYENIELNSSVYTKIHKVKTVGVQKLKVEIVGIIKATKKTTHLEAEFNQQVHTWVVDSPLLMNELDIKLSRGLQSSLVDKVPFIADIEVKGNKIKKIKVVSMM